MLTTINAMSYNNSNCNNMYLNNFFTSTHYHILFSTKIIILCYATRGSCIGGNNNCWGGKWEYNIICGNKSYNTVSRIVTAITVYYLYGCVICLFFVLLVLSQLLLHAGIVLTYYYYCYCRCHFSRPSVLQQ